MGAVGLNGATREVHDHTQRLRVADAGWFRWSPFAGLAMTAHLAGTVALGRLPWPVRARGGGALPWLRAVLTGSAIAATAETGRSGRRVVAGGDVPVATAVEPISDTPPEVAAAQRRLRVGQWLVPALTGTIWIVEVLQRAAATRERPAA